MFHLFLFFVVSDSAHVFYKLKKTMHRFQTWFFYAFNNPGFDLLHQWHHWQEFHSTEWGKGFD